MGAEELIQQRLELFALEVNATLCQEVAGEILHRDKLPGRELLKPCLGLVLLEEGDFLALLAGLKAAEAPVLGEELTDVPVHQLGDQAVQLLGAHVPAGPRDGE